MSSSIYPTMKHRAMMVLKIPHLLRALRTAQLKGAQTARTQFSVQQEKRDFAFLLGLENGRLS